MLSAKVFGFTILILLVVKSSSSSSLINKENEESENSTTTTTTISSSTIDKVARRIIDERLTPPRTTEFSLWNKKLPALGEIHHRTNVSPPKVTEDDIDDDKILNKKTIRTVGPSLAGAQGKRNATML